MSCLARLQLPCFQVDGKDSECNEEGGEQGGEGEEGKMSEDAIEENEKDDIITPLPVSVNDVFFFYVCLPSVSFFLVSYMRTYVRPVFL